MFIKFTNNIIEISPITYILNLNYEFKKFFQSQDISPLNILDPKYHVKRQVNKSTIQPCRGFSSSEVLNGSKKGV